MPSIPYLLQSLLEWWKYELQELVLMREQHRLQEMAVAQLCNVSLFEFGQAVREPCR